jgi:hypothetical protein
MELFTKANISMTRKMATEFIHGRTIEFMKDGGLTASNMAWEFIKIGTKEKLNMGCGKIVIG